MWVTRLAGADLLVYRKTGVPLATLGVYVPRPRFDPPNQAGLGTLLVRSAVRGAGDLDAAGLAFAFERLGGTLATSSASDWLGFGASVLAEHLPEAALLLDAVFTQPRLTDADIIAERGLMVAEAEQVADDMFRYPFQLAFSAAFGDQGYGLPVGGLPETLPAIAPADVRGWHGVALRGVRPVVIAVGDVDPERASGDLAGVFDAHPPVAAAPLTETVDWLPAAGGAPPVRVVPRDKAQAALAMAFPGPSRRHPDHAAAQVWSAIASGLGGRLFEALRDRRSLAYTVIATPWQKARGGALLTYIATSPEREAEAREQMLVELERFTREPVGAGGAAAGGELSRRAGGGEPAERRGGGGGDPRGVGRRRRTGRDGRSGRAVPGGHRRRRAAGGGELARSGAEGGRGGAGNRRSAPAGRGARRPRRAGAEPAGDHLAPAGGVGRLPGDHIDQADPFLGQGVNHDVPVLAEHPHRDSPGSFPHDRRSQRGQPDRAGGGHHDRRETIHVGQAGRNQVGQLEHRLVEGGVHGRCIGGSPVAGEVSGCPWRVLFCTPGAAGPRSRRRKEQGVRK